LVPHRVASVTTQFSYSLFSLCLETQRRSHAHTTRRKCEIVQNRECAALRAVEHKSTGAAPSGATHVPPHTCATTYTYCIASTGLELETPISSDMREQGRSRGRAERDASAERARVDSHHCSLTRDRVHANHEARRVVSPEPPLSPLQSQRIRQLPPSLSPGALVAPGTRAQHSTGASHGCESNCSCEFDASPILHRGLLPCPSAAVWLLQ